MPSSPPKKTLPSATAGDELTEDNIVIVEVGEKFKVATFDEVWPIRSRPRGWAEEEDEKRIFNGDMAVSSKLLSLSLPPLGEVVLTFFEEIPPPFMRQSRPAVAGQIPSIWLRTLRERLEKANLKVREWNLAREDAPPQREEDRKQVLLVLPVLHNYS